MSSKGCERNKAYVTDPRIPLGVHHSPEHQTGILVLYLLTEAALTDNNLLLVHVSDGCHGKDTFMQRRQMG